VKKPKAASHQYQCGNDSFSCIDCGGVFYGQDFEGHVSCVSEAEKYQGKLYKPKQTKERANSDTKGLQKAAATNNKRAAPQAGSVNGTTNNDHVAAAAASAADEDGAAPPSSKRAKTHSPAAPKEGSTTLEAASGGGSSMQVDDDSKVSDAVKSILQTSYNTPNSAISMKRLCKKVTKQLPSCSEMDVSRAIVRHSAKSVRVYWREGNGGNE